MKRTTFFSSLLVAALGIVMATPASATTFTWVGDSTADGSDWQEPSNWNLNSSYPQSGDTAIIVSPAFLKQDPVIYQQAEAVSVLNIQNGGLLTVTTQTLTVSGSAGVDIDAGGTLDIGASGVVIVSGGGGTHPIGGTLKLSSSTSILKVSAATTFGLNGDDKGMVLGQHNDAKIDIAGVTLTNNIFVEGMMTVREESGDATFLNGSTGVVRANAAGTLKFASGLTLDDTSACSPSWEAITSSAILEFNEAATSLVGTFVLDNCAKMLFNANITTVGKLVDSAASSPKGFIDIENSSTFAFRTLCDSGSPVSYNSDQTLGSCP
ncbi:MAG: hypothetical protein IH984_14940 [Planctomycetes bacterium]|nr:hypothetical protein [Planctomycetota bacterium]